MNPTHPITFSLAGKSAIVTGGCSGIRLAIARIAGNPEIRFIERRTPLGRLGQPEEVVAFCHFLASDEAAYITGQNIAVDGGLTVGWTGYDLMPPANIRNGRWVDDV